MSGNDIFALAAAYLGQSVDESADVAALVPCWLSVLLAEALPTENQLRALDGRPALEQAPALTQGDMDGEIPYADSLVRVALPYGLASDMLRDDDNDYRCQDFRQKYVLALAEAVRAGSEPVRDVYA